MNVKEMRDWLEGDKPNQIAWRTNNENLKAVSQMVTLYAQTPGGKMPGHVWPKIEAERAAKKQAEVAIEAQELREKKLEQIARADYLRNGGSETEFNRNWKSIKADLLASGRAEHLIQKDEAWRRSQSVRTF